MKHIPRKRHTGRRKKGEWIMAAGLIAYLISLVVRIPLGYLIGDKGIGFLAPGIEIFTISTIILSYGISKAVTLLIKYRIKREMYKGAARVFKSAMFFVIVSSAAVSLGIFLFAPVIAQVVVLEDMSYLAIAALAPAILLSSVMGVLKGYFQGVGTAMPTIHSKLLEKFIMFAGSLILGIVLYTYGLKVAALLRDDDYASAYGALGAALGLTVACIFGVLHLLFIYAVYGRTFRQQIHGDSSKYTESGGQLLYMLISASLPYMVCALLYNMNYLAGQRIFNYAMNIQGKSSSKVLYWGVYYGKYSVVVGIAAILFTLFVIDSIQKTAQFFDRQDYRVVQEEMRKNIHKLALLTIPCAVLVAVLAEPLAGVLFKGDTKLAASLIQMGTAVIVLFPFTYFFAGVLQRIRRMKTVIIGGLIAFPAHLAVIIFLINNTGLGIRAVVLGNIVFYLIACAICLFGIMRYMHYSQEWIRTFAITLIAAGISGLIATILNKVLLSFAGAGITLLICAVIGWLVYSILIIVFRGVGEKELMEMPGGKGIISIAQRLHLI